MRIVTAALALAGSAAAFAPAAQTKVGRADGRRQQADDGPRERLRVRFCAKENQQVIVRLLIVSISF